MGKLWQSCIKTKKLWSLCYFPNPPTNVKATHQVNSPTPSTHNVKMDLRSKGWSQIILSKKYQFKIVITHKNTNIYMKNLFSLKGKTIRQISNQFYYYLIKLQ